MVGGVLSLVVFTILLYAGSRHVIDRSSFREILTRQSVLGRRAAWAVALIIPVAECFVGLLGIAATIGLVNAVSTRTVAFGCAVLLFAGYAIYSAVLVTRKSRVTCGCTTGEVPASPVTVIRAALLIVAAVVGMFSDLATLQAGDFFTLSVTLLASATFTALLWIMPSALSKPPGAAAWES